MPREPLIQIATNPASATRIDSAAKPNEPRNVASAGFTSRKPNRTIRIEHRAATAEKTASRRAHAARADTGSDW